MVNHKPSQSAAPKRKQTPKAGRILPTQWVYHKAEICKKYLETSLSDMMKHMLSRHGFSATKRQYVYRLGIWGCKKYNADSHEDTTSPSTLSYEPADDSDHQPSLVDPNLEDDKGVSYTAAETPGGALGDGVRSPDGLRREQKQKADILYARRDDQNAFDCYQAHHNTLVALHRGVRTLDWRMSITYCALTAQQPAQVGWVLGIIQQQIVHYRDEPQSQWFYGLLKAVVACRWAGSELNERHAELSDILAILHPSGKDGTRPMIELSDSHDVIDMNALVLLRKAVVELDSANQGNTDRGLLGHFYASLGLLQQYVGCQQLKDTHQIDVIESCVGWCRPRIIQTQSASSAFSGLWSAFVADSETPWAEYCERDLGISVATLIITICLVLTDVDKGIQPAGGFGLQFVDAGNHTQAFIEKYLEIFADNKPLPPGIFSDIQEARQVFPCDVGSVHPRQIFIGTDSMQRLALPSNYQNQNELLPTEHLVRNGEGPSNSDAARYDDLDLS